MHKIKVEKLLHHGIHNGIEVVFESLEDQRVATTPKKKAQNGDIKMYGQSYYTI
jgi:hypothetical protein